MTLQQQLQDNRRTIREFLKTFDDTRLAEVYAFNADGKMDYNDRCGCLRGVQFSRHLHISSDDVYYSSSSTNSYCPEWPEADSASLHYQWNNSDLALRAEGAYEELGWDHNGLIILLLGIETQKTKTLRQRRLSSILRAAIRLRESAKKNVAQETALAVL